MVTFRVHNGGVKGKGARHVEGLCLVGRRCPHGAEWNEATAAH